MYATLDREEGHDSVEETGVRDNFISGLVRAVGQLGYRGRDGAVDLGAGSKRALVCLDWMGYAFGLF